MRAARLALGALGLALLATGAVWLLRLPLPQLAAVGGWVAGGIVVHDGVLVPLVLLGGALVGHRLGRRGRGAVLRLVVLVGPLTLVAVPVLGRFGAKADNPTLLDTPAVPGYVVIVLGAAVASGVAARRASRSAHGPGEEGR